MTAKIYDSCIIADIGGTHARFCCIDLNNFQITKLEVLTCADYQNLAAAIQSYLDLHNITDIHYLVIGIACPIIDDEVKMTNLHWQFSIAALKQQFNLERLIVLNDFAATSMAIPLLTKKDLIQIGEGQAHPQKPILVLGAGTGLGVSHLIPYHNVYLPLAGEGGHSAWSAQNEKEWFIHRFIETRFKRVSNERLLSGPGIENIYQALIAFYNLSNLPLTAAKIAEAAIKDEDAIALETIHLFLAALGCFAGDLALTLSTFGGVYIAGGIVPKLLPLIANSAFREKFEDKGRFQSFNRQIPTFIITAQQPGLIGAAFYLKQALQEK